MNASLRSSFACFAAFVSFAAFAAPSSTLAQSGGVYDMSWNKIANGGVPQASGGAFTLSGTVGQADAGVLAGGTYRLNGGFWNGVALRQLLDVPDAPVARPVRFALRGFPSNPVTRSGLEVTFALPNDAPAVLDLIDVHGRSVRSRVVGSLGAGEHRVRFEQPENVGPGVYWIRLRQGAEQRVMKAVVLR
ncbi:MAG: hypothetical protein KAY61_00385 [Candidatus Eisenbacteria bacterium]|nr:hypothetical protein [Candidatus Eisenbacteria bacterium]